MIKLLMIGHVGKPFSGISIYYESLLKSSIKNKVNIAFIDSMTGTKTFSQRGVISFLNLYNALQLISKFLYQLVKFRPDIVDIATSYQTSFLKHSILIILSRLTNKRVILRPRCSIKMFIPKKRGVWMNYVLWVLRLCDGIIVLSSEWDGLRNIISGANIVHFPNAIDLSSLSSITRAYEKDFVNILFLGHIGREKGVYELVDAIQILGESSEKNFKLYIVGESLMENEVAAIEKVIEKKRLFELIEIRPPAYDEQKLEYLKKADMLVLPSYHEGMPVSIIEAMAAGLPVIATCVGGIPDLIESGVTGIIIPPKSPTDLSAALKSVIHDKNTRSKLGRAAREMAIKRHDIENYVDQIVRFYSQTLEA